jgi:hypothetical protein
MVPVPITLTFFLKMISPPFLILFEWEPLPRVVGQIFGIDRDFAGV